MSKSSQMNNLECTLDRWEAGKAVLTFSDGQELILPRRFMPKSAHEGDILHVDIHTQTAAKQHHEALARAILQEILNGSS